MGHLQKFQILIDIFKDEASLIKTRFSTRRRASSIRRAILRTTTHDPHSPPPEYRIHSVLSFGHGSRPTARACIRAVVDRLHRTHNVCVALKSLFTIHNIISRGSLMLKDQISFGGPNFLNLSTFRDDRDPETWELSLWVRWYGAVLEQNVTVSRVLGYYICSSKLNRKREDDEVIYTGLNSNLVSEIEVLVGFVEEISEAPKSLHLQRKDLIYELVRLVSEDYRLLQREILIRVAGVRERRESLSEGELTQLLKATEKLEECRGKLTSLFVNRNKNQGFWESVTETKTKITGEINKRVGEKALCRVNSDRRAVSRVQTIIPVLTNNRYRNFVQTIQLKDN